MKTLFLNYFKSIMLISLLIGNIDVNAQTLFINEDFNLVAGSNIAGQNDWTLGASYTNRAVISTTGLTYPNYPNQIGLAAVFVPKTDRVLKKFTGTLSGTYFYSFLINVSAAGSGESFIGFYSNSALRSKTYIKSDGAGFQFGLAKTQTIPIPYTTGTPFSFGTTYLVVLKYEFLGGSGTDDKVSLFVNPNLTADNPGTPAIGPLTDPGNDVTANVLAIQGCASAGSFTLDGIRIAPDWASIQGKIAPSPAFELPKYISSNMVLQQKTPLKFNGWGITGDTIKVEFERQGVVVSDSTIIDTNGRWNLTLPSQEVSAISCTLKFGILNKPNTIQNLDNILVGDVWLAGGQSNMDQKVSYLLEAAQVIAEANNYPLIRSFNAINNPKTKIQEKVDESSAPWIVCNSTQIAQNVSAVAYIFAREIYKSQNIPIGILQSYRGGTGIETWMSGEKIRTDPELSKSQCRIAELTSVNLHSYPSINYNGQIHPIKEFPIKGFIYYQGEGNVNRAYEYRLMMKKLIEDWRNLWGMGNLPFYYVQLFNMGVSENQLYEEGNWQDIREQQEQLLSIEKIPNIGMAVSIDTNEDPNNANLTRAIHSKNKLPVGERLAKVALKNTYGLNIIGESPMLSHYRFSNDTAYLVFKNYGDGLKIRIGDAELKGFVLAGVDKVFGTATAEIINDSTIILKSNLVGLPVSARYAWSKNPICNLYNSADLPASPFRTDTWTSGFQYTPASQCAISSDASLMAIRLNGAKLTSFHPEILNYNLKKAEIQQITAYTNSPYSTFTIEQATAQNGRKATIVVQAEDKTMKTYMVYFDNQTSLKKNLKDNFKITQQGKNLVVDVDSKINGTLKIINLSGQNIINKFIAANTSNQFAINSTGIYLALLNTLGSDYVMKFVIR